eukprot:PhM_4_TR7810/c0_g1_i1/m.14778
MEVARALLTCDLCNQLFNDPVYNDCCGHVHCRRCIRIVIESGVKNARGRREKHLCPTCFGPVFLVQLRKNFVIDAVLNILRQADRGVVFDEDDDENANGNQPMQMAPAAKTAESEEDKSQEAREITALIRSTAAVVGGPSRGRSSSVPPLNPSVLHSGTMTPVRAAATNATSPEMRMETPPTEARRSAKPSAKKQGGSSTKKGKANKKQPEKRVSEETTEVEEAKRQKTNSTPEAPPSPTVPVLPTPTTGSHPVIVGTGMRTGQMGSVYTACGSIGGCILPRVADTTTPLPMHCTHVLWGGDEGSGNNSNVVTAPTLRMCEAILRGVWLVGMRWVADSAAAGRWLPEHDYELSVGVVGGPLKGRERVKRGEPPLFDGERFALHESSIGADLARQVAVCIEAGGGEVLPPDTAPESCSGVVTALVSSEDVHAHETSYTPNGVVVWRSLPWWVSRVAAYLPVE